MSTLLDTVGYFIPFPRQIPAPLGSPEQYNRDRALLFGSYWEPYITGALKVLTRPEIYAAPDVDTAKFAMDAGQQVLGMITTYPVPIYFSQVNVSTGASGSVLTFIGQPDKLSPATQVRMACWQDPAIGGVINVGATVRDSRDETLAGCDLSLVVNYQPIAGKAYVLTGHSCTGLISDAGFVTDGYHQFVLPATKDFSLSIDAINLLSFELNILSDPVCGVA